MHLRRIVPRWIAADGTTCLEELGGIGKPGGHRFWKMQLGVAGEIADGFVERLRSGRADRRCRGAGMDTVAVGGGLPMRPASPPCISVSSSWGCDSTRPAPDMPTYSARPCRYGLMRSYDDVLPWVAVTTAILHATGTGRGWSPPTASTSRLHSRFQIRLATGNISRSVA